MAHKITKEREREREREREKKKKNRKKETEKPFRLKRTLHLLF